jgi:2',3'-cyclic-nucleotide 2'-phosphodiesterase/3'-nucleotidase
MKGTMRNLFLILLEALVISGCTMEEPVVRIAVTTDIHGMIFPYDFIDRQPTGHSLSHIYSYVVETRSHEDTLFLLLDNGDILQGQPTVYYYNFIDTCTAHLVSRVMNYMGYAAGTVGNHDIEAGPAVYNRVRREFDFPWLAANAVNIQTGKPCFTPYTVLKAGKSKVAIFGLITPGIPQWLPENLWQDMEFRDMVETAREWIPIIIEKEKPDLVVGLFHSGTDAAYGGNPGQPLNENAVMLVARQVPGFDIIFAGHDHRESVQWVTDPDGDSVLVVDPGSHGRFAGEVTIALGRERNRILSARNVPMTIFPPSPDFLEEFEADRRKVSQYLEDTITWLAEAMDGVDALFGPSSMMSLIHRVQLDLTGADLSFTAPLSISAKLDKGPLLVSDMFKLYRFENMLYAMELTGTEIDGFLEHAAGIWFNTMVTPGDHLLQFSSNGTGRLAHPSYNFSSAAGIDYTIDVTRPPGDRVAISRLSDGTRFQPAEKYLVAINSYRGNGGGGHLTAGAGIPANELSSRVKWSTDIDLRYYLMHYMAGQDTLVVAPLTNWHCIPKPWVKRASISDRDYFE